MYSEYSNNCDVNKICRVCLNTETNCIDIFSSTSDISSINQAIMECASISILETDTLPHAICTCCLDKLEIAYNFRKLCIQTDQTLRNNAPYNTIVKDEQDEQLTITPITNIETFFVDHEIKIEKDENSCTESPADNGRISDNDPIDITPKKLHVKKRSKKQSRNKLKHDQSSKNVTKRDNDGYFYCKQCTKKYKTERDFRIHLNSHTNVTFNCDKCDKIFYHVYRLKRHISIVHATERKYNCEFCGLTFRSSTMLRSHQKSHSNIRQYKCEICSKEFKLKKTLKKHSVIHKDIRPFVCDECGRSFKRKDHLTVHAQIHNGKRFRCVLCSRTFISKQSLNYHLSNNCSQILR